MMGLGPQGTPTLPPGLAHCCQGVQRQEGDQGHQTLEIMSHVGLHMEEFLAPRKSWRKRKLSISYLFLVGSG